MAIRSREALLKRLHDHIFTLVGTAQLSIPGTMSAGNYAEFWADGVARIFDRNGFLIRTVPAIPEPLNFKSPETAKRPSF